MTPPWTIRLAQPGDDVCLGELHVTCWREAYTGLVSDELLASLSVAERQAAWKSRLPYDLDKPMRTWVADAGEDLLGFAGCSTCRDEDLADRGWGEITAAYIRARCYGTGLGAALVHTALDHLREQGHEVAALWVLDGNERAIRFYKKLGFKADGSRKQGERNGHPIPEHRMRLRL